MVKQGQNEAHSMQFLPDILVNSVLKYMLNY